MKYTELIKHLENNGFRKTNTKKDRDFITYEYSNGEYMAMVMIDIVKTFSIEFQERYQNMSDSEFEEWINK